MKKSFYVLAMVLMFSFAVHAEVLNSPAYSGTIQCNFKKSSNYFEGDCWVPNQVNDLVVNFDGLKKGYSKPFMPDRRVNARVFPSDGGYSGTMQGRKVEDPTKFDIVTNKKGEILYGKLPFGWFYAKAYRITDKEMNIVFDASHQVEPSAEDIAIVKRAKELLASPSVWDRADTRQCPADQTKYSIFCAMIHATEDVTGYVHYRQPAMQAFRETINEVGNGRFDKHRLQDWNNHPDTTFEEVQDLFNRTENNLKKLIK